MKVVKTVGILSIIAGIVLAVAGIGTWITVTSQLKDEAIVVPDDSEFLGGYFQGKEVSGPLSAFAQAEIINKHALGISEGNTYAELGSLATQAQEEGDEELAAQYQAQRDTVMNASFLRASLFTSVVAYGVAALVMGLGVLFVLMGWALTAVKAPVPAPSRATEPEATS